MQESIYQQYKTQSLETLTNGEIVVKLFEEASKQITMAIFLTNQKDAAKAYNCIAKAQKIISALDLSLDMHYPISIELRDMYLFLHSALSDAIVNQDTKLMKELLHIVDDFKITFRQADKIARANK
ncbi:MAG: flagellar protein FliS [Eubacteriales bacterium]|nr:flagellar protein FliS [Eubacteriales bacterium]